MLSNDASAAASAPSSEGGERLFTLDQLACRFRVSKKTISRWRQRGLIGRRLLFGGCERIGFLQSSVDRFVAENAEQVRRGTRFRRMTDVERRHIVERARHVAQAGELPIEVARKVAGETGRGLETIRAILRRFDRQYPDAAIFPYRHGPLPADIRRQVYQEHRRGESLDTLARRFSQRRLGILRIIDELSAARIMLHRESHVKRILGCLDEREMLIVTGRFGLAHSRQPLTLKQIGDAMGVSKERIRQIQNRALGKLRMASEDDQYGFGRAIAGTAHNPARHNRIPVRTNSGGER